MLFVFHWILYSFFFVKNRIFKGMSRIDAYHANPFERECHANDDDLKYLFKRKPFAWTKYMKK